MKRYIALIIWLLAASATAYGQLVFDTAAHDFGTIREADGPVSCTFRGENKGTKPVVLLDVVTTCGCTVPAFSRKPVLPGERTEITVRYDPANRPGHFRRELGVYTADRSKIASLEISGDVSPREKSVEELYPVDAGGGLRLSSTLCALTYIYVGQRMQSAIGYVNTTDRPLRVSLRSERSSGILTADMPGTIAPGERGAIGIVCHNPQEAPRYGAIEDLLRLTVEGRESPVALLVHGYGVDNPADLKGKAQPALQISENTVKFGVVKHRAPVRTAAFTMENTGRGELVVRSVASDSEAVRLSLEAGSRIPAGGSVRVEVLLDPRLPDYGALAAYATIITNDPNRPMRRVRVTAIIED